MLIPPLSHPSGMLPLRHFRFNAERSQHRADTRVDFGSARGHSRLSKPIGILALLGLLGAAGYPVWQHIQDLQQQNSELKDMLKIQQERIKPPPIECPTPSEAEDETDVA